MKLKPIRSEREYDEAIALPRPAEYATDTAPAIDYVHHALEVLEGAGEARFDAVVILQPTSPTARPSNPQSMRSRQNWAPSRR